MQRWKQGDRVRVCEPIDEIGDERHIGRTGTVVGFGFEEQGIGATRNNPLVIVWFDLPARLRNRNADGLNEPGYRTDERDGFWSEELAGWL